MPLISNSFQYPSICNKRASSLTPLSPAIIQIRQRYYPCAWQMRLRALTKPSSISRLLEAKKQSTRLGTEKTCQTQ